MKNILTIILCSFIIHFTYSQNYYEEIQFDTGVIYFDLLADTQHIWQVGPPQKSILDSAFTKPNVLITDTILPYSNNIKTYTDLFILNYCWGINLNFKYKIDSEKYRDGLKMEMSYDHTNWFNVAYRDSFHYENFNNSIMFNNDSLYTGEPGITGSDSLWHKFNLEAIFYLPVLKSITSLGRIDSLWFRFTFMSDSFNTGEGFMLDSFSIVKYCGGNIRDLENNSISIYPNPAQNILHIENELNQYYDAKIYNAQSGILKQMVINRTDTDIDIADYPKGLYMLQLIDDKAQISYKKFIKE